MMSLIGDDNGASDTEIDQSAPSPWETIEPEEIDREPEEADIAHPVSGDSRALVSGPEALQSVAVSRYDSHLELPISEEGASGEGCDESRQSSKSISPQASSGVRLDVARPRPGEAVTKPLLSGDSTSGVPSVDAEDSVDAPARGGGWTIPLLCVGIGLIACCLIIPQADANRRMAYQRELLHRDLESIQQQVSVNEEFLKRVNDDAGLSERLAQRQMNVVRAGNRVWRDPFAPRSESMSPFELTTVPRPAPLPPYQPMGGWFSALCRDARSNLYLTGVALLMLAAGLVMGVAPRAR